MRKAASPSRRAIADTSENGTWTARVVAVDVLHGVAPADFAPPPPPDDASLRGVATVPIVPGTGYALVAVSLDGGPPMRFVIDTGGQNAISVQAARRAGLTVVGAGKVGGVGASLADVAFASVRSVRIGGAEMRDQPFVVLDLGDGPVDGIIGYELLARFAARIDFAHGRVELARDVRELNPSGTAVRMVFDDRQPQVDGALDGIPGAITIDTGSVGPSTSSRRSSRRTICARTCTCSRAARSRASAAPRTACSRARKSCGSARSSSTTRPCS